MGVITGTITGVSLLHGNTKGAGSLKTYLVGVNVPAYTSSDTLTIADVAATIDARTKSGKSSTLYGAVCVEPAIDTASQACYPNGALVSALTISSDTLTGELCSVTPGAILTSSTACKGALLAVVVTEA